MSTSAELVSIHELSAELWACAVCCSSTAIRCSCRSPLFVAISGATNAQRLEESRRKIKNVHVRAKHLSPNAEPPRIELRRHSTFRPCGMLTAETFYLELKIFVEEIRNVYAQRHRCVPARAAPCQGPLRLLL